MDDIDLRIFRWMYPGGTYSWWGTDPRFSTAEIGRRVGLKRTAVWARIRHWREEGFWDGFGVHVNPRILGADQVRVEIPVLGPVQGAEALDQLEHVNGVLCARVGFGITGHGREGEALAVWVAAEDATRVNRRIRLLRRLSSTGDLEGPFHDAVPPCSYHHTSLDWRVLAAVIANPNASPLRLARLVGVTLKTFDHHHALLIESHALFYLPMVDWSKLEFVGLEVYCRGAGDVDRVRAELQARYPASIPMDLRGWEGVAPEWDVSNCIAAMVPARSPNAVRALIRDVSRIPRVRLALAETWGPKRLYLDWVNRRVAERIAATSAPSLGLVPPVQAPQRVSLVAATSTEYPAVSTR